MPNSKIKFLIENSDVILYLIDARFPQETYAKEIIDKIKSMKKPIIIVATKVDLIDKGQYNEIKKMFDLATIAFSAKMRWNTKRLKITIYEIAEKMIGKKEKYNVAVIGYPNVGKSSLISALKGKTSAKTSAWAGFTKELQKVRINRKLMLWDTPGFIETKDETILALVGAINPEKLSDCLTPAQKILQKYGITIEQYAEIMNYKIKNNELDLTRAARDVLKHHLKGDLHLRIQRIIEKIKDKNVSNIR